jgi:hypothetical protein
MTGRERKKEARRGERGRGEGREGRGGGERGEREGEGGGGGGRGEGRGEDKETAPAIARIRSTVSSAPHKLAPLFLPPLLSGSCFKPYGFYEPKHTSAFPDVTQVPVTHLAALQNSIASCKDASLDSTKGVTSAVG